MLKWAHLLSPLIALLWLPRINNTMTVMNIHEYFQWPEYEHRLRRQVGSQSGFFRHYLLNSHWAHHNMDPTFPNILYHSTKEKKVTISVHIFWYLKLSCNNKPNSLYIYRLQSEGDNVLGSRQAVCLSNHLYGGTGQRQFRIWDFCHLKFGFGILEPFEIWIWDFMVFEFWIWFMEI